MNDLFGNEIIDTTDEKYCKYLNLKDEESLVGRVKRLKYLHKINPDGLVYAGDMELVFTYREVQFVFIEGFYFSTLVLAQAFIEKLMQDHFERNEIKCQQTFDGMLKYAVENKLFHEYILRKIDFLRLIRNPITHLKSFDYEYNLSRRSFKDRKDPLKKLEDEAHLAITIMTYIAMNGFN